MCFENHLSHDSRLSKPDSPNTEWTLDTEVSDQNTNTHKFHCTWGSDRDYTEYFVYFIIFDWCYKDSSSFTRSGPSGLLFLSPGFKVYWNWLILNFDHKMFLTHKSTHRNRKPHGVKSHTFLASSLISFFQYAVFLTGSSTSHCLSRSWKVWTSI